MAINKFIENLKAKFPQEVTGIEEINTKRLMIYIKPGALLKLGEYLFKDLGYRYIIVSASDIREGYELVYHFSDDSTGWVINLNAVVPKDKPEIESLTPVIYGIEWIEREIFDIMGIKFLNHPNLKRFLFAESWEDGKYPYRRENK